MWILYHLCTMAANYLLYFLDIKIIVLAIAGVYLIVFRLFERKKGPFFSWYVEFFDHKISVTPEQLIHYLGDFENIREISKKDFIIRVEIFDDGFVCKDKLKKSGLQYETDDGLNFYFGNKTDEYYNAFHELIQQNLQCLKL